MFTTPTTSTNQIQKGANAIGAIVGEDWFSGRLVTTVTDSKWNSNLWPLLTSPLLTSPLLTSPLLTSPLLTSEIYNGKKYDSRIEDEIQGWSTPNFNATSWPGVKVLDPTKGKLSSPYGHPGRRKEER
ncbi:hypothetical protein jhhlp_004861 [Lomentospora prolificans]|uniref:Bacterial alpha-L-rhamnosidase N-terminal domain-containing protein n=1 Tax=Lomentospora prolificans TaxID=41688 RepID=A0A2N3N7S8_9PEZI|nr:hypothetical protein jhhlp_004861 [Lomentospora prolificans]